MNGAGLGAEGILLRFENPVSESFQADNRILHVTETESTHALPIYTCIYCWIFGSENSVDLLYLSNTGDQT